MARYGFSGEVRASNETNRLIYWLQGGCPICEDDDRDPVQAMREDVGWCEAILRDYKEDYSYRLEKWFRAYPVIDIMYPDGPEPVGQESFKLQVHAEVVLGGGYKAVEFNGCYELDSMESLIDAVATLTHQSYERYELPNVESGQ
jgi:hypothetical protein